MVKAVVGEETRLKLVKDRLSQAALLSEIGLVIGKLSKRLDKGFVYDLIPTPLNEAGEPASSLIKIGRDDNKKKGSKSKPQSDSSTLFVDKDWITEHARQGLGLLTLTAVLPFKPSDCQKAAKEPACSPPKLQIIFFFCALYLVAIAQGGHQPCVLAFGLCLAVTITLVVSTYIQDNLSWGIGFGIPCLLMAFALAFFLPSSHFPVSRMLLGGIMVIGVYISVNESTLKNSTTLLCQTVKRVADAVPSMDTEVDESLLIHISYSPRRWTCRNCSLASSMTTSSLRPCDFKMGKVLTSLKELRCKKINLEAGGLPLLEQKLNLIQ